jgi:pseudouridine kinase
MGIVVIGSVFVDIKGYPLSTFVPTGRNAGRIVQVHGGVSRNIAEDIANVELRPTFVSLVDESGIGQDIIRNLKAHRVNTDYIRCCPDGFGTWLAVFDQNGDVAASISQRPDLSPIGDILAVHGDEIFSGADSIVVEFDFERKLLNQIFDLASRHHVDVYAAVSNMSIAMKRRDLLQKTRCFVCNELEASQFFLEDLTELSPEKMRERIVDKIKNANIPSMIVTMGEKGAVYADEGGESGVVSAQEVNVSDTTGAGDAFFAGVTIGLTYGKSLRESCKIGTRLAASVIVTQQNVCPRFRPEEFGIVPPFDIDKN